MRKRVALFLMFVLTLSCMSVQVKETSAATKLPTLSTKSIKIDLSSDSPEKLIKIKGINKVSRVSVNSPDDLIAYGLAKSNGVLIKGKSTGNAVVYVNLILNKPIKHKTKVKYKVKVRVIDSSES